MSEAGMHSPSAKTVSKALPQEPFADLYKLIRDQGLAYFARINGEGNVELYLVFESIEEFSQSTHAEVYVEFKTYQDKLLAVIWTLDDPRNPLGFPVPFHIQDERERNMALRLIHQPQTWIHYLAYEDNQIIHIYSEAISFPPSEKPRMEGLIRNLYEGGYSGADWTTERQQPDEEVRELETESAPVHTLPPDSLDQNGVAYVFDYQKMIDAYGAEEAQMVLMQAVHQAMLVIRRHFRSEVRETTFTIWAAEKTPYFYLFLSPSMADLFDVIHYSEEEENPFSRFLLAIPQFIETREGTPLAYGAYPIMRYEQGRWIHLELDEAFQATLSILFSRHYPDEANPYE